MLKFIQCPKCEASIENIAGTKCWNCGHVVGGDAAKTNQGQSNLLNTESEYYDLGDQTLMFATCKCGAQNDKFAVKCWECGQALEILGGAPASGVHSSEAPKKKVPFSDIVEKPPEEKEKKGLIGKLSDALKPGEEGKTPEEIQKEKERQMKKERRLILFHCNNCGDYFKVLFRKVRAEVKCPVCKNVKMKIPYFCTKCKCIEEFTDLGRHVCPRCNLDLILDPHFE
ncbi:MAG: hypothetical protein ACFFCS_16075 [Candidatus Hodarchaeota archaeon]